MTREEAINEINKVFTSAYANYIVTALTEGATVSDIQHRWGRAYEAGVKDGLEQKPCEDAVSRAEVKKIAKEMYLEVANMKLDAKTISDCISYTSSKCREVLERKLQALPSVTPQEYRWIPMVSREPTDEEKAEYLAQNGEELCYMLENEMPLNGQKVLVSIGEFVSEDIFDEDFYNFENNDVENVDAWMPLPEPYKGE